MKKFISTLSMSIAVTLCLYISQAKAQTDTSFKIFNCGASANYFSRGAVYSTPLSPTSSLFDTSAIYKCGKIAFYYEDINRHFHTGFDDTTVVGSTTLGAIRRNTFCNVANYLQSLFDFSGVPDSSPVRIYIDTSFSPLFHLYPHITTQFFAVGTPYYDASTDGIKNGYMNDYVNSGTDPSPGQFHAMAQVNFDKFFIISETGVIYDSLYVPWQNNSDTVFNVATSCGKADLFSVLTHEMGHCLGWFSLIDFVQTGSSMGLTPYPEISGRNVFSGVDWSLRVGNNTYPLSLTKVLDTPFAHPTLDSSNSLFHCNSNYWLNDSAAPRNLPVYSGSYVTAGGVGSYLSHLDDQAFSYSFRGRISPGDQECYVMGPSFNFGVLRRNFAKGEIQSFVDVLGYSLNPSYSTSNPHTYSNHTPFSRKMASYPISILNYAYFSEEVSPDDTLTNNVGSSRTIYIDSMIAKGDVTDTDAADISHIIIDSTTLVNIRGCGNGGNNHSLLHVSSDGRSVTYTPRANFYGKAQFAFNLHDGKERGSYVVVTIEVKKGTNVTYPYLSNMICNPDFEEGTEIKIKYTQEEVPNSYLMESGNHEGRWHGICFSDSHPYCFDANIRSRAFGLNSGIIVRNSNFGTGIHSTCGTDDTSTVEAGKFRQSFPDLEPQAPSFDTATGLVHVGHDYDNPEAKDSVGDRYQMFSRNGCGYYYLTDSTRHCHRYLLDIDLYRPVVTDWSALPIKIGFADRLANLRTVNPDTTMNFVFVDTLRDTTRFYIRHPWTHHTISFWYCGDDPSNILYLKVLDAQYNPIFHIDNISLKEDTTPAPPLNVSVAKSMIDSCTALLTPVVTNAACDITYYWAGSGITGTTTATVSVTPTVTTTYSVTVSDECRSTTATYTVTINALPAISGSSGVCRARTTQLTHSFPGGVWSSSDPLIATVGSANGLVTGVVVGVFTVTYTVCGRYVTRAMTVNPLPGTITGPSSVCVGSMITLSSSPLGGVWSSSNISIAGTGSGSGFVVGISSGVATISYTLPTGCFVTKLITVNPLPVITGATSVCEGLTATLSGTPTGGVWASGNLSIATIGTSGIVTGVSNGVVDITYTGGGCSKVLSFTVNPMPAAIVGIPIVCVGSSTTFSNTSSGGIWTSSNTGVATIGSSSGIATGVSVGTSTISYVLPAGCYVTSTLTVITTPAAISGTSTVCVGATAVVTDATPYGVWSSGNPSVVTIGSSTGGITGIAVGTATITYSLGAACYSTKVITVNPTPPAITGVTHLCPGSAGIVSNSVTGGTFSSSNPSIASTGATGGGTCIVAGISSGVCILTYTLSTGCYVTTSFTVDPIPAPITGPSAVCVGSSITLGDTSPGGSWSSSSSGTATVGTGTGIVTGILTGTVNISYTFIGTVCYVFKTITVNPLPDAITGTNYVCEGSTTTLSDASSGGTWSSGDPIVASIGSATGIVTGGTVGGMFGTAIISYTLSTGCMTTTTVTVYSLTDDCSPCYHLGDAFSMLSPAIGSSPGSGSYYMSADVTITNAVTFPHSVIFVAPGKHIYVNDTSVLTVSGTHLFSCSGMWEGITLQTGSTSGTTTTGRLVLEADADGQHSLIEDATTAVRIESPVTPSGGGSYFLTSESTTFNRNITGISIKRYNDTAGTYPFRIRNTVFTSRDISAHWAGYPFRWPKTWSSVASDTAFKHSYTHSTDPIFMPPFKIDDPDAMGTGNNFPGAACKSGALPTIGIRLDSVGTFTPSGSSYFSIPIPSSYSEIKIGDETGTTRNQYENLFDNLRYGIHATNTNFTCVNNSFINIFSYTGDILPGGDPGGYGVFALASTSLNRLRVHSGSGSAYTNKFYGFRVAVGCNNYFNFTGKNTYMINKNTGVYTGSMVNSDGEAGYKLKTAKYSNIDISYDTVTNVHTGIVLWISVDPGGYASNGAFYPSQLMGPCNITYNRIQAHPTWTAPLGTERINQGIVVQNTISGGPVGPISSSRTVGNLNVSGNLIHNAYNGIFVNNYWPQNPYGTYTSVDTIYLRSNPVSNIKRMRLQYGINHTHSRKGYLYDNEVHGLTYVDGNDSIRAYYASSWNSGMDMGCNMEENVGRGYEFFLTNPGTQWHDNEMTNSLKGMVLNGGLIGPQRNTGYPMNNKWLGTWGSGDTQTYVYNGADAAMSRFYVNNTSAKNPALNSGDPFSPAANYVVGASIYTTSATYADCYSLSSPPYDTMDLFTLIAQQHVVYTYNTVSSYWMGQYAMWKSILMDSSIVDSSAIAAQFAHMADSMSRYKYLTEMESLLATGDFDSVTVMLGYDIDVMANTAYDAPNQVSMADGLSANFIVEDYKQFYSLYMKYATSTLSGSDSLDLLALAELCPQIHGGVVHQARALYSIVFNDLRIFDDDSCLDVDTGYIAGKNVPKDKHNHISDGNQNYKIYPNPNDGNFIIQQYIQDTGLVLLTISDAVGRSVYQKFQSFQNGKCNLSMESCPPGIYLFEILDNKKQKFRCKFVITKQ